jgi:hypothetical protein
MNNTKKRRLGIVQSQKGVNVGAQDHLNSTSPLFREVLLTKVHAK